MERIPHDCSGTGANGMTIAMSLGTGAIRSSGTAGME